MRVQLGARRLLLLAQFAPWARGSVILKLGDHCSNTTLPHHPDHHNHNLPSSPSTLPRPRPPVRYASGLQYHRQAQSHITSRHLDTSQSPLAYSWSLPRASQSAKQAVQQRPPSTAFSSTASSSFREARQFQHIDFLCRRTHLFAYDSPTAPEPLDPPHRHQEQLIAPTIVSRL